MLKKNKSFFKNKCHFVAPCRKAFLYVNVMKGFAKTIFNNFCKIEKTTSVATSFEIKIYRRKMLLMPK